MGFEQTKNKTKKRRQLKKQWPCLLFRAVGKIKFEKWTDTRTLYNCKPTTTTTTTTTNYKLQAHVCNVCNNYYESRREQEDEVGNKHA